MELNSEIQEMLAEKNVEGLIAKLKDKNKFIRSAAALALGQIGTPAVEPLIAVLKDKDEFIRSDAVVALGQIGSARAMEPLIAALNDKNEEVRSTAKWFLKKLGVYSQSLEVKELLLGLPVIEDENISKYRQKIISAESHPSMFVGSTNETAGFVAKMLEETQGYIRSCEGISRVEKQFLMNDYRVGEKILEIQYQQFWNNGTSSIYSEHVMRIGEDRFEVFGSESSAKRMKAVWK